MSDQSNSNAPSLTKITDPFPPVRLTKGFDAEVEALGSNLGQENIRYNAVILVVDEKDNVTPVKVGGISIYPMANPSDNYVILKVDVDEGFNPVYKNQKLELALYWKGNFVNSVKALIVTG